MAYWDEEMMGLLPGAERIDPYRGLLGGMMPQDRALSLMALGAGMMSGKGRNAAEAAGSGFTQGLQGLLGVSALSGRQKALAEETYGREQDRGIRQQQFEMMKRAEVLKAQQAAAAQAASAQQAQGMEALIQQNPQFEALIRSGVPPEKLLPQMFPKPPEQSPLAKLIAERDALPQGSPARATYDAAIQKSATHQPPLVQMGFGSPVPVETPQGPRLVLPPTKPGGRAEIVEIPGVGPVSPPGEKPPAGYRRAEGGALEAIPGGPADKPGAEQQKQSVGVQNLKGAITEYRNELKGFTNWDLVSPSARARMGTKYNNMLLQAKEAYNLGVLNGPDYMILQSVITDPRSFLGAMTPKSALDTQASELDRIMSGVGQTVTKGKGNFTSGKVLKFDAQGNQLQ